MMVTTNPNVIDRQIALEAIYGRPTHGPFFFKFDDSIPLPRFNSQPLDTVFWYIWGWNRPMTDDQINESLKYVN